jgi:hypothetical protein
VGSSLVGTMQIPYLILIITRVPHYSYAVSDLLYMFGTHQQYSTMVCYAVLDM